MTPSQKLRRWADVISKYRDGVNDLVAEILRDNAPFITDLVAEFQMRKGIEGTGEPIRPEYTPYTVYLKGLKGQPTDFVTLRDTGEFYASLELRVTNDSFVVYSDDPKAKDLAEKYSTRIFNLTEENLQSVIWDYIFEYMRENLNNKLFE